METVERNTVTDMNVGPRSNSQRTSFHSFCCWQNRSRRLTAGWPLTSQSWESYDQIRGITFYGTSRVARVRIFVALVKRENIALSPCSSGDSARFKSLEFRAKNSIPTDRQRGSSHWRAAGWFWLPAPSAWRRGNTSGHHNCRVAACTLPCRRFANILAKFRARLGAWTCTTYSLPVSRRPV